MSDSREAPVGTFLMSDLGESTEALKFLLLRAKRQHQEFTDDDGKRRKSTSIGILGFNLDRMTPFIMRVSITSFSNFGKLMAQIKEKGLKHAWDHAITISTEKREELKDTARGRQKVKWYVINFYLDEKPVDKGMMETAEAAYLEYAGSLDWRQDEKKEKEVMGGYDMETLPDKVDPEDIPL